jgi:hypothetical protein
MLQPYRSLFCVSEKSYRYQNYFFFGRIVGFRRHLVATCKSPIRSTFGWLVVDGWCWFVLREEYCWLVAGGWFVLREKYCWLVADKPSEQGAAIWYPVMASPYEGVVC